MSTRKQGCSISDTGQNTASAEWIARIRKHFSQNIKVEITPQGSSMYPTIRRNDTVILDSPSEHLHPGDICLYQRSSGEMVLHRLCRITEKGYFFSGDNQNTLEGPLRAEQILACAHYIRRRGRLLSLHRGLFSLWTKYQLFRKRKLK